MFTDIFWRFLILEALVIGVLSQICPHVHPQVLYCGNQFALKAAVNRQKDSQGRHSITIQRVFKGDLNLLSASRKIKTNININFRHGNVFAIFGYNENGIIRISSCTGIHLWKFMRPFQRRALNSLYSTGCNCRNSIGTYSLTKYCKWRLSYMKRVQNTCKWIGSSAFTQCKNSGLLSG